LGRGGFEQVKSTHVEYQFGDDIRNIDWNVTARLGHPYVKVFEEELKKHADDSIILDGIPRTLNQAKKMDPLLAKYGKNVDFVFEFRLDDSHILERILGRFSCKTCGAAYHKEFNKPKADGVCDFCSGTDFLVRSDDQEDVLKKRLELYYLETQPILGYYKTKQVLHAIDANLPPSGVGEQIKDILKMKADRGE
jgi:adenylate kinase